tara:strand:+ start:385989 stop:386156 length:168 start_codon:yes stop_codon:yes gene_type:complete
VDRKAVNPLTNGRGVDKTLGQGGRDARKQESGKRYNDQVAGIDCRMNGIRSDLRY